MLSAIVVFWYFRTITRICTGDRSWQTVVVGVGVFGLWSALEPASRNIEAMRAIPESRESMPRLWAIGWLAARVIGSIVVIPLAEELAFRGYLTRRLIAADFQAIREGSFTWSSFLLSSILFGVLHQRRLAGTAAGMLFAVAYYRRGKLIDAVLAHSITNFLITLTVLSSGEYYNWS